MLSQVLPVREVELIQGTTFTFNDVLLSWLNSTSSESTKRAYRAGVESFFNTSFENVNLDMIKHVTISDVKDYIDELKSEGKVSSTIKNRLSAVSSLYDYLLSFKSNTSDFTLITFNPFHNGIVSKVKSMNIPKGDTKETEVLTDSELELLYNTILKYNLPSCNRDYAIVKTILNGGLRRSELCQLKIKDIQEVNGEYWIHVIGKGNKSRKNYINHEVVNVIEKYLRSTNRTLFTNCKVAKEDFIFKGVSSNGLNNESITPDAVKKMLAKYCRIAEINKNIAPHGLRHKTITTMIESGVKPQQVMEFAGHTSIETTMRYYHNLDKQKNNAGRCINL